MDSNSAPSKILLPFANAGGKNTIPVTTNPTPGGASYTEGFPAATRTPIAGGGIPPSGLDMNGVLFEQSAVARWVCAGGLFKYDAALSSQIGGYPKGARLINATATGVWVNDTENNTVNPDTVGTGWHLESFNNAALTGDPTAPTAPLFDNDTSIANTAFLQRALGNLSGEISLSGASTLTNAALGNLLFSTGGTSFATTLPLANTCRTGTQLVLFCKLTAGLWTIQRQGSDIIDNAGTINSFTMGPGDTAVLESNNVGTWRLIGGSASLRNSSDFKATIGANAYQTLPSTWIVQRGSITIGAGAAITGNVTLPVAFPVAQRFCAIWANELNNNSTFGAAPAAGNRPVIGTAFPTNASSFAYDARTTDGSSIGTASTIRLNWISIGE